MPRARHVLKDVSLEVAQRRRKCYHQPTKHQIERGEPCLVIRNPSGEGGKNYCRDCALEILQVAADDLQRLRDALI
jgi:hypothetical protein